MNKERKKVNVCDQSHINIKHISFNMIILQIYRNGQDFLNILYDISPSYREVEYENVGRVAHGFVDEDH